MTDRAASSDHHAASGTVAVRYEEQRGRWPQGRSKPRSQSNPRASLDVHPDLRPATCETPVETSRVTRLLSAVTHGAGRYKPTEIPFYEGLIRATASRYAPYVPEEYENIVSILRNKVWRALRAYDPSRSRALRAPAGQRRG
jgi:hypothetical protein